MYNSLINRIQKRVFFIILLMSIQFIHLCYTIQTPTFPNIMLNTNMTILTPLQTYGLVDQIRVQGDFIFRLSMTGKLMIWSAINKTLLYRLFDGQGQYGLEKCLQYDLSDDNGTLVIYTQSQQVIVLSITQSGTLTTISTFIPQYNISSSTDITFHDIEIVYNTEIVIFIGLKNGKKSIERFTIYGNNIGLEFKIIMANVSLLQQMKICQLNLVSGGVSNNNNVYYVAVWKDNCYFQIHQCLIGGQCSFLTKQLSTSCTQSDLSSNLTTNHKLQFSYNCQSIIFNSKNQGYGIYNITSQQFSTFFSNSKNVQLSSLKQIQIYGYKMIFHFTLNGVFFVNQYSPDIQQNLVNNGVNQYGDKSAISMQNGFILTGNDSTILFYQFYCQDMALTLVQPFICLQCPLYCTRCDLNGQCSMCLQNYTLITANNTCVVSQSATITPEQTNITIENNNNTQPSIIDNNTTTIQNNTNIENNTTNNTNNTQQQPSTPSQNKTITIIIQPKYQFQSTITDLIKSQSAQNVINASVFSLSMLQLFPFSFLFMRFINFWSICTFYLFLHVQMPTYLYDILYGIYQGINTSIFQTMGVDIKVNIMEKEKVGKWMNQQFGISSDFLQTNIENFVLLLFSYFILWSMYILKTHLDKNNLLRRGIQKIDLPMAIIGQYVAIMNGFFLIIPVIQLQSSHTSFLQKLNISLHIIFILISLTIIGYAISYISYCQCKILKGKQLKTIHVTDGQMLRQWVINCLCNSILPAFAVYGNIILYLVFNTGLFVFFLYAAFKVKEFKFNSIILALQLIIFHISFIVLAIFDPQKYPFTFHSAATCLVVIIFLGAIHQFLSFIMSIFYAIYCSIKNYLSSVANISQQQIIQKGEKTEIDISQHQSQTLHIKKPTAFGLKKMLSYSPGHNVQIQSLNQTNFETSKSVFKKQNKWTKKQHIKNKKAVKFDIDQMKNPFHFKKAAQSQQPLSIDSPQQIKPQKTIQRRKPYFSRYKSIKQQLKQRKVQQTINKDNQNIHNIYEKQKTDVPIIKHTKDISLYKMKSMKLIENNVKKSLTPSQSQKDKSSIYVSTKSIKGNFKIQMFNIDDKQQKQQ